jgi:Zn finger protein HypA/HybF involved in hydrogenase expression
MKILKRVEPKEWEGAKCTCHSCTSVVMAQIEDLKLVSDQREQASWVEWICPVCHSTNNDSLDKVPKKYQYGLRS